MAASKPASTRARRNKTATRAMLRAADNPEIPGLPSHTEWHESVQMWWHDIWSSPMAPEWTTADQHTLFMAAQLMQQVWDPKTSAGIRVASATEARHLLRECGLTPMSRRSLQWEIERGESAEEKTRERRTPTKKSSAASDPRKGLHAV